MNQIASSRNSDSKIPFLGPNISKQCNILTKKKLKIIYSEIEIRKLLDFYKDEYIYLKRVDVKDKMFYFTFKKFNYPYFKVDVKHLTREQTIVFVTQAAYFFGIVNNLYDDNWDYPLAKFLDYVQNEKLGFTNINIKYRRFTENKKSTVLIFNSINYRKFNGKIFGEINFELEKYCSGYLNFFIDL